MDLPSKPDNSPAENPNSSPPSFWIIDGHEDIAWNGLEKGRDPSQSAYSTRDIEEKNGSAAVDGKRTLGFPEWIAGKVGIVFSTLFVEPARFTQNPKTRMSYHTPEEANQFALEQLAFYRALAENDPRFTILTYRSDLEKVVPIWEDPQKHPDKQIGLVLLMEGADPIIKPEDVPAWAAAGVRIVGLAWSGTRYAGGTHEPGPLTILGRALLKELDASNLILDLSHSAEEAYLEAVETYPGTIIASHSNPRSFFQTDRSLTDEMIIKLVRRDGVMGIVPYNHFLDTHWKHGDPRLGMSRVIEAIDYVVQLVGDARHVALGTDFDGGFGAESIPAEWDSIADVIQIASALQNKGYQTKDIQFILNGNWLRVLKKNFI